MDDGFFRSMKIGVAGLGLIGGSLALALSKSGFTVYGFDADEQTVSQAIGQGAVADASCKPDLVLGADCLFVALYPEQIVEFIKEHAHRIPKGALVLDCCGIKQAIFAQLAPLARTYGFVFIGGHPMAGTENNGFSAACADLFAGASFILTPPESTPPSSLACAQAIVKAAGFSTVRVTSPAHHDRMIAFTSQLPHVLACAYVKSPCYDDHADFSAGSFRDVSRVAHINPELWTELFLLNGPALCEEIDALQQHIAAMRDAIAAHDGETLTRLLAQARRIKDGEPHAD